jgi:hypothetical protein
VFVTDRLRFGTGLAIDVALPQGAVEVAAPLLVEPESSWPDALRLLGAVVGIAVLLAAIILLLRERRPGRPPRETP